MATEILLYYPLFVEVTLSPNPVGTCEDDWGITDVYEARSIYYENMVDATWAVHIEHPNGKVYDVVITPFESGTKNLPTPQRFETYPLSSWYSLVRL